MRTTPGAWLNGSKKPGNEPDHASSDYQLADNEYVQQILQKGQVSQFEAISDRTEDKPMKKLNRKRNAAPKEQQNEMLETAPAAVGHNSAREQEMLPDQLETLRDILVGPSLTVTESRLKELLLILEEREDDLNKREEALQQQINYVQSDVTEREQALNKKISQVEAELAAREEALFQKVSNVERELEERENSLTGETCRTRYTDWQLQGCTYENGHGLYRVALAGKQTAGQQDS